jgi:hypothetical protein
MPTARDRLLSYAEVGDLTGRSARTVRRWVRMGLLKVVGIGRARWVREADLIAALSGGSLESGDGSDTVDAAEIDHASS